MNPLIKQISVQTYIGDFGQIVESFALTCDGAGPGGQRG